MKRAALYIFALLLGALFFTSILSAGEAHKRTVNGKEEYELRIANETGWFVIAHIDGRRQAVLNPSKKYANQWDGSMMKLWLTLGPHRVVAFAYNSRDDITNNKPSQKTAESSIDVTRHVDKIRGDGAFRVPILELNKSNFEPWTTPARK